MWEFLILNQKNKNKTKLTKLFEVSDKEGED